MSAAIYYRPAKPFKDTLSTFAPQDFMDKLEKATGLRPPCTVGKEFLRELRVLAKLNTDGGGNPFEELVEAIEKYGEVELEASY